MRTSLLPEPQRLSTLSIAPMSSGVFVDIPEQDANYVEVGSKATVLVKAYRDDPIAGSVTRVSLGS